MAANTRQTARRGPPRRRGVVALALASILSSAAVFPHGLSYFNEPAGGPLNGAAHLLDANIDWGQDLLWLKQWQASHLESRAMRVTYFGPVQPRTAEINPARLLAGREAAIADGCAISLNELYGYRHDDGGERDNYASIRRVQPAGHVGYSMVVFRSSTANANAPALP